MLNYGQVRHIVRLGVRDGAAARRESDTDLRESYDWDENLINAIGGSKVCKEFGLEIDRGEDWETALLIYTAACNEGARIESVAMSD